MHGYQKGRSGNHDKLKCPQTNMRDWEEVVIADTVAAWLLGVADEAGLLVTPNTLCCHHQDQDAEDEDNREPDSADACRMSVHPADDCIKRCPVHLWFRL
uniref:Uncharacterized protein n=1 Tax=Cynoglossus semilaevis TaxID=244447 RepID=A0A3P8W674_CYNSE